MAWRQQRELLDISSVTSFELPWISMVQIKTLGLGVTNYLAREHPVIKWQNKDPKPCLSLSKYLLHLHSKTPKTRQVRFLTHYQQDTNGRKIAWGILLAILGLFGFYGHLWIKVKSYNESYYYLFKKYVFRRMIQKQLRAKLFQTSMQKNFNAARKLR